MTPRHPEVSAEFTSFDMDEIQPSVLPALLVRARDMREIPIDLPSPKRASVYELARFVFIPPGGKQMANSTLCVAAALLTLSAAASATTFTFNTNPFAGSDALTTPGRQIVGGEAFITFNIATDVFALGQRVFGVGNQVLFANDVAGNLPTSGVNVIVLQSFDNDNNPATPFAAGTAANLIADQITSPGPGFFIYFNQGLDLPRLVFSTDLNDNTADLKILFRMTNLTGQGGRDAIPTFTAANFAIIVPEPSTLLLLAAGVLGACGHALRRKRVQGS